MFPHRSVTYTDVRRRLPNGRSQMRAKNKAVSSPTWDSFFLASFGCAPHYIPSKNFRFSSILTLQCFHMLRFIFMWTFMSSCSRVQTTHAARLPSRLICPLGIWSAELVALWLWVGLPNGPTEEMQDHLVTKKCTIGPTVITWSQYVMSRSWWESSSLTENLQRSPSDNLRFLSYSSRVSRARSWSCKARWRAYVLSVKKEGRSSWIWGKIVNLILGPRNELLKVETCVDVMTKCQIVMDGHCSGRASRVGTKNCKTCYETC